MKEIINLQPLTSLKILTFKDPQYGMNPINLLSNYSLYLLYHLPNLTILDTLSVNQKQFQEIVEVLIKGLNVNSRLFFLF